MNAEEDGQDKWAYKVYRVEFPHADTVVALVGYAYAEHAHLQMTHAVETILKMFGRCVRCSRTIDRFDDHQPCLRTPDGALDLIPVELPASLFEHVNEEQKRERLRDKGRAANGRRKAALEQDRERHTEAEIDKLYAFQQGRCYYCNAALVDEAGARKFTKDHLLAVMSGGSDGIRNIVLCCDRATTASSSGAHTISGARSSGTPAQKSSAYCERFTGATRRNTARPRLRLPGAVAGVARSGCEIVDVLRIDGRGVSWRGPRWAARRRYQRRLSFTVAPSAR